MKKIFGECNQCGVCCFNGLAHCENLEIIGIPGEPGATRCKAYATRYHRMPIRQLFPDGSLKCMSECLVLDAALAEGVDLHMPRECSLELVTIDPLHR